MSRFTFKLPDIGEGIASAEIVAWHVKIGDHIGEDAPLVDMLTDKATVEIETPVSGVVVELAGEVGAAIAIGAMLAVIEVPSDAEQPTAVKDAAPASASDLKAAQPVSVSAPSLPPTPTQTSPSVTASPPAKAQESPAVPSLGHDLTQGALPGAFLASPAVRARAKALRVDLSQVRADGPHIRHADLDAFLHYGAGHGYGTPQNFSGALAYGREVRRDEVVPVIGMRRRIAENMAAAKRHIAHFTYVEEVEVTALEDMRAQLNAARNGKHDDPRPRLTLLPLLITAICRALKDFPMLNAHYDDAGETGGVVTRFGAVHMGIATQTGQGLMVPVLKNAQGLNLWQMAGEIARLADAARNATAKRDELQGSTMTITSLGALGGIASTPVINRPEVAILGVGRIMERPIFAEASGDRIRRAKLMNLSIACDHRVVDGWDAASFVAALKRLIESPALLLAP